MTDFNRILDNINEARIDISSSNKYDEIIEFYKMTTVNLIIPCEVTLYKICETNNLKKNLNNDIIYEHLNIFLQRLLLIVTQANQDNDINKYITSITKLTNDKPEVIHDKIFDVINNYYNVLARSEIKIKNIEKYKKFILKSIISFFNNNTIYIIELIKDKNYKWQGDYSLSKLDSEIKSSSSSNKKNNLESINESSESDE